MPMWITQTRRSQSRSSHELFESFVIKTSTYFCSYIQCQTPRASHWLYLCINFVLLLNTVNSSLPMKQKRNTKTYNCKPPYILALYHHLHINGIMSLGFSIDV
eukprot:917501_1